MAFKYLAGLMIAVLPSLVIANPEVFSTSPLLSGTKIVAGPNKDEFFILAQNDPLPPQINPAVKHPSGPSENDSKTKPKEMLAALDKQPAKQMHKSNKNPERKMLASLSKQTIKSHANQATQPHWIPKLKKALVGLKKAPASEVVTPQVALKQRRIKKPLVTHKKQSKRILKVAHKNKLNKKSEIMTFHVAVYTPAYGEKHKKPVTQIASNRPVTKVFPLQEKDQVVAFNAD